jgi:hypothetical protein
VKTQFVAAFGTSISRPAGLFAFHPGTRLASSQANRLGRGRAEVASRPVFAPVLCSPPSSSWAEAFPPAGVSVISTHYRDVAGGILFAREGQSPFALWWETKYPEHFTYRPSTEVRIKALANAPKKTRAEREAELQSLWRRPGGRARLADLYGEAIGSPAATIPNSSSTVFKAILDKEFPNA